ncbi:hypothetical protein [Erythrobacter sp. JK5]|uniref:DUF6961 family protein n=1 Tax=Erythrobacter sp. JK5 TaxID=2829500 RepID=UPI001BADAE69|nr:hypothetical protein [Erythrobacter sp. JK5]QUL38139.1 hypothetical protein KDC96_01570 [Erythrobacter sp. JK5]
MTRDEEIWAMALWVEKHHGSDGWLFIAQKQDRLFAEGEFDGVKLWQDVGSKFEKLQKKPKQCS